MVYYFLRNLVTLFCFRCSAFISVVHTVYIEDHVSNLFMCPPPPQAIGGDAGSVILTLV